MSETTHRLHMEQPKIKTTGRTSEDQTKFYLTPWKFLIASPASTYSCFLIFAFAFYPIPNFFLPVWLLFLAESLLWHIHKSLCSSTIAFAFQFSRLGLFPDYDNQSTGLANLIPLKNLSAPCLTLWVLTFSPTVSPAHFTPFVLPNLDQLPILCLHLSNEISRLAYQAF